MNVKNSQKSKINKKVKKSNLGQLLYWSGNVLDHRSIADATFELSSVVVVVLVAVVVKTSKGFYFFNLKTFKVHANLSLWLFLLNRFTFN
jgi:hypothetical protein